jgi:site-specific recombinase XerD
MTNDQHPMTNDNFTNYLHAKSYRLNSIKSIMSDVRRYCKWCNIPVEKSTYNTLLEYVAYMQTKGLKARTINGAISKLQHYFNYLYAQGKINSNPAAGLRVKGVIRSKAEYMLSREELNDIYNNYKESSILRKRNKVMLGLIIYQGLDTTALKQITVNEIHLQQGIINISSTARSNERILPLEPFQILQLQNYLLNIRPLLCITGEANAPYLFLNAQGNKSDQNQRNNLNRHLKAQNPKYKDITILRKSVIVNWINTYGLRKAQYLAGHKYVSSTEQCSQNKIEDLQELINQHHPLK